MTCRLYIDEVGNGDLHGAARDPNIRYLSLTGLIMKVDAHDRLLQPALDRLKLCHLQISDPAEVILHRREIVRREGAFAKLRDGHRQRAFDEDLLKIVEEQPFLVMTVVIDKKEHLE